MLRIDKFHDFFSKYTVTVSVRKGWNVEHCFVVDPEHLMKASVSLLFRFICFHHHSVPQCPFLMFSWTKQTERCWGETFSFTQISKLTWFTRHPLNLIPLSMASKESSEVWNIPNMQCTQCKTISPRMAALRESRSMVIPCTAGEGNKGQ